jgi:protein-L-isoaspartate(D-aspartate) O-methyltransferase
MNVEQARFNMIEQQIRPWDVLDQDVLSLLSVVRREDFVPPAYRALAFVDMQVPLPEGQFMLEPKVEARLMQDLKLARHEKVLEVGAGSGHMAALLAHRVQQVFTLDNRPTLARLAADNLRRAGVMNATAHHADGAHGLPAEAPFDAILLSGSVASVPSGLLEQLKVGGRLMAIVGEVPVMRATRVTRVSERDFRSVDIFDTVAPRLDGFAEPPRFRF